jgi:hypothetical protein
MELNPHIPRMIFQFHNLHTLARVVLADEIESCGLQPGYVVRIDFIAMSVPLFDLVYISV